MSASWWSSTRNGAATFARAEEEFRAGIGWEVSLLAYHNKWAETDILSLPTRRRRSYLKNLAELLKSDES